MNLCKEEASSVDLFDGKPLEKVAKALHEVISGSDDGVTIGLDGEWGSGKSTVVRLLKEMLGSKADMFVFDAWAHEGDALRRSFLEAIIRHYVQEIKAGSIHGDDQELTALFMEVAQRKKITKIIHTSKPTGLGILFLLTILAATIGCGLLACCRPIGDHLFTRIAAIAGAALVSTPFLIMISNAVAIFLKRENKGKRFKALIDSENWSFIESSGTSDVEEHITDESEKSSIEFECLFTTYVSQIIQENPDKKFVIVIDNLDRINVGDALKIWSTLQTFLQNKNACSDCSESIYKKLWIVVPYDGQSIAKLWDKNQKEGSLVSKSFLEKCFQLRVDVPTPVMATWVSYAKQQAESVFEGKDSRFVECVVRMLCYMHETMADSLTPREIKTYLNEIAITRQIVDPSIEDESVCYYVYCRYLSSNRLNMQSLRSEIIKGEIPAKNQLQFLPNNVRDQLAGITYGVDAEQGKMLLLTDPILQALVSGDGKTFKDLRDGYGEGFWNVFDYVVGNKLLLGIDGESLRFDSCLKSAKVVNDAEVELEKLHLLHERIGAAVDVALRDEYAGLDAFEIPDERHIEEMISLIRFFVKVNDISKLKKIYEKIGSVYDLHLRGDGSDNYVSVEYIKMLRPLIEAFPEGIRSSKVLSGLDGNVLNSFVKSVNASDGFTTFFNVCRPASSALVTISNSIVNGHELPEDIVSVLHYLAKRCENRDWRALCNRIKDWLFYLVNNGYLNKIKSVAYAYDVMLNILYVNCDEFDMSSIIKTESFYRGIGMSGDEGVIRKAALLSEIIAPGYVWGGLNGEHNYNQGVDKITKMLINIDQNNINAMIDVLGQCDLLPSVWLLAKSGKNKVFNAIVSKLISDGRDFIPENADFVEICKSYSDSFDHKEDASGKLVPLINILHSNKVNVDDSVIRRAIDERASCILAGFLDANCQYKDKISNVLNIASRLTRSDWVALLEADPGIVDFARAVVSLNHEFMFGAGLFEALEYIIIKGTEDERSCFEQVVTVESYLWLIKHIDPILAYELGANMIKAFQCSDWSSDQCETLFRYTISYPNFEALQINSIHERIKELLTSDCRDKKVAWIVEVIDKCQKGGVWCLNAEVAQIVELVVENDFKEGRVKKNDAEFIMNAYGLKLMLNDADEHGQGCE